MRGLLVNFILVKFKEGLKIQKGELYKCVYIFINHLAPVVQRVDNFIHWISHYPAEYMYSNQCFWQVFHTIPFLNLTYASTLFTNYRTIIKILHTFYLLDSKLSSGYNYPPFEQLAPE